MKPSMLITSVALLVALAPTVFADGANWPRFRGEGGAGISNDAIPVKWTGDDFAWKTQLPGKGHSSPVVWGQSVFVTAADEETSQRLLLCLSAADGNIRWQHAVDLKPYRKHGDNSFASSTPTVDDQRAYVLWPSPESFTVVAVKHDGIETWRQNLGPYRASHGGGSSPVVVGDVVVVNLDQERGDSFIAGLDRATGEVRWKTPRASTKFSSSTPCLFDPPDGSAAQLVFATHANGFTAIDPVDGRIVWELPGVMTDRVVFSPIVAGDLIVGGSGEGGRGKGVAAAKPPAAKDQPASVVYTLTEEVPYVPTPIVHNGRLFTWSDSGIVSCHEAATGKQIWTGKIPGRGFYGSPVCAAGKLYCVSKRGEVHVIDATADAFQLLATNALGEQSHATPAIAGGRMYLRTLSHVICIRGNDRTASR